METARVVWPLALAMAAGTINHFCDRLFLAHVGDAALEAILPADMMSQIVTSTLGAIIGYSATFVAQAHGGGRPHQAVRSFAQGLWLTLMSIPLFIAAVPLGRFLVGLAGHAEEIRAAETAYFSIVAPGGFLNVLNIVLAGILTGQGRTRHVGFSSVAGCALNLALNPLLIFGLGSVPALGISGAAIATVVSRLVVTALLLAVIVRDPLVRSGLAAGDFAFNLPRTFAILRFGLPLGCLAFVGCGSFTFFTFATGRCSPLTFAASNVVFAVNNIFYFTACAIAQGTNILTARHHGAGDDAAAINAFRSSLWIAGGTLLVCFAFAIPGAGLIMDLFRGPSSTFDPAAFRHCGLLLFTILFFREIAEGVMLVVGEALRGVGDTRYVMMVQATSEVVLRLPLIFLVSAYSSSIYLLWLTMPIDMGLTALLLVRRWRSGRWRAIHLTVE